MLCSFIISQHSAAGDLQTVQSDVDTELHKHFRLAEYCIDECVNTRANCKSSLDTNSGN